MNEIAHMKLFLLTLSLLTCEMFGFSQNNSIVESFFAIENNGEVFLSWKIIEGSTCNGIQILHSTDSLSFSEIGNIAGVCGSTTEPQYYNYTDETPEKNKYNYYRLSLGGNGYSEIISIELIDINNKEYQVRPNPVKNYAKIYFDNTNNSNKEYQLFLYNPWGDLLFSSSTSQEYFEVNLGDFNSGIYHFIILSSEKQKPIYGKLLVHD